MMTLQTPRILFTITSLFIFAMTINADVPPVINYQGRLTDSGGNPVSDDAYEVVFTIYDAPEGGDSKWTETQSISTSNGLFTVLLGTVNPISDTVFGGTTRFLSVTMDAGSELLPRTAMVSVPYAQRVSTIDGASGGNIIGDLALSGKATLGPNNTNTGINSFVLGKSNNASGENAIICGGWLNTASGAFQSTVGGGAQNTSSHTAATVAGGQSNTAGSLYATVSGGFSNTANGASATVSGGYQNVAGGDYSFTVGYADSIAATGDYSVLFGIGSKLTLDSTFMVDMPHVRIGNEADGFELPTTDGTSGQVMITDGAGQVSWSTPETDGSYWTEAGGVLYTTGVYGLSRFNSTVWGINNDSTHINLGVHSTTGAFGFDYKYITISGGYMNTAIGDLTTIGGGANNSANDSATISGGYNNTASGSLATIGGGRTNLANGNRATIGGGSNNHASGQLPTVGGGYGNYALDSATVSGGSNNTAGGIGATISGGCFNAASGNYATVGGGLTDTAGSDYTTIAGGWNNKASNTYATISGGCFNLSSGAYATIGGGNENEASFDYSTISGGFSNTSSAAGSAIGGGFMNRASAYSATVGGGRLNKAKGDYTTVGGGEENTADSTHAVVSGGKSNSSIGYCSAITGGAFNTTDGSYTSIGGGHACQANADYAAVGGGYVNHASGEYATVGGGSSNDANGYESTVSGGFNNTASGEKATVSGGETNTASGLYATVSGGKNNTAGGNFSFAAGHRASATHSGSFVWSDNVAGDQYVNSSADNQFTARASGGVRFYTDWALTTGVSLSPGGGSWSTISDSTLKENIRPVDDDEILDKLAKLEVSRWNYKTQDESIQHIGPMAQDFYRLFGVGDNNTTISTVDPDGISLAAIKALIEKNKKLEFELAELKELVKDLIANQK